MDPTAPLDPTERSWEDWCRIGAEDRAEDIASGRGVRPEETVCDFLEAAHQAELRCLEGHDAMDAVGSLYHGYMNGWPP